MKNQVKFKAGDLVYCPSETAKICQLKDGKYSGMPLIIEISTQIPSEIHLTADGKLNIGKDVCYIVHATQENYELLSKLYPNVEFEPPPKRKEPREIIQALLDDGNAGVLCWVSDIAKTPKQANSVMAVIVKIDSRFIDFDDDRWLYATPITPIPAKLNQTIIDFVNGEVVLESGNAN